MLVTIDKGGYLLTYSDSNKQILETTNNTYWNATEDEPIAVDKTRFANNDYIESDKDIEICTEDNEEMREEIIEE